MSYNIAHDPPAATAGHSGGPGAFNGSAVAGILVFWWVLPGPVPLRTAELTAGRVALLVDQRVPENVAALRAAVTDSDVDVRTVAARVAGAVERHDLIPLLIEQLAREPDEDAGAEQLRALLFMRGAAGLPEASAAAMRLGGVARIALADWLARKDPDRLGSVLVNLVQDLTPARLAELAHGRRWQRSSIAPRVRA